MKFKKLFFTGLIFIIFIFSILTGCISATTVNSQGTSSGSSSSASASTINVSYDSDDYYFNWKEKSYTTINLDNGASTITKSGIYEITGTLTDGSLIVDVDKSTDTGTVYMVLNGADISSQNSAPIYIKGAKKVVLMLEDGTKNIIYQGSNVTQNSDGEPSAAVFSKADLTITGNGTLNVTSDFNDGITSKDDLKITGGIITVTAAQDGIVGKDLLAVKTADITITSGKDGMRSTNDKDANRGNVAISDGTFNITAQNDAIQAYAIIQVDGGTFNLTTGGGYTGVTKPGDFGGFDMRNNQMSTQGTKDTSQDESYSQKALKSGSGLYINNGTFNISSVDDALHSNGDVTITNGNFIIQTDDDGVHSDVNLKITGGDITIKNCYEGLEGSNITIDGGKMSLTSSDDGVNVNNSAGVLTINGGEIYINAGGDGVDSNGTVNMTGGTVYVDGPTDNGNGAIDYDKTFAISGGTIIAAGSSGMAQTPSSGSQASILMYYKSTQTAYTTVTLKDQSGNVIASFTPQKQYSSVAISAAGIKTGTSYILYSGNTQVVTFTPTSTTTYLNESGITTSQSNTPGGDMNGQSGGNMNQNRGAFR